SIRAVTANFFALLGIEPEAGRLFGDAAAADDRTAVVLSYRVWQRLFDGRADVVGRSIWIDERPYTVIGVLPPRFWYSAMASSIWPALARAPLESEATAAAIPRRPRALAPPQLQAQLESGLQGYAATLPAAERALIVRLSGVVGTPMGSQMSIVLP